MDAQSHPHSDGGASSDAAPRRKCTGKRAAPEPGATPPPAPAPAPAAITIQAPCGACKFLRRKCVSSCIFAPHFGSDQGAARFAAVHKVFGASNVSKLLLHIPANRRHDAVVTISYEAQARLSDPVYGCVASLQAELAMVAEGTSRVFRGA
nr:LOB domain-containing protein 20-like [Ipomoea trifida]